MTLQKKDEFILVKYNVTDFNASFKKVTVFHYYFPPVPNLNQTDHYTVFNAFVYMSMGLNFLTYERVKTGPK